MHKVGLRERERGNLTPVSVYGAEDEERKRALSLFSRRRERVRAFSF